MKIVSFNVNSLRQRLHQLQAVIDKHTPEFIGLQETKVQDHEFPGDAIAEMGYQVIYAGQKTHYGVALLSRSPCSNPCYGFPDDEEDAQKRFIGGEFEVDGEQMLIFNGYFPQGETRDQAVTAMDWMPTILELAGIEKPKVKFDGASLVPMLKDKATPSHYDDIHWQWGKKWAVRQGDWKLLGEGDKALSMHSLADDQPEEKNYLRNRPVIAKKLHQLHRDWAKEVAPK